jgi:Putative restriction endonuclease
MPNSLMELAFRDAEELGVRLEIVDGLGIWEAYPALRHVNATSRIERSIHPDPLAHESGCGCKTYADLSVRFPDGSLKRPDIAIFCRQPDELDEAVTLIPEAVIEVVSRGSEVKDLELNPAFYRKHGIPDIVVFNPYNNEVRHYTSESLTTHISPVELRLQCRCLVTV